MKPILFSLLLLSLGVPLPAEDYTLGPDSQPQDDVPKGAVTKFVLPPGKTYPGTPHNCAVYVPAQYDASKPTPFMIFLDGSQALGNSMRVPVVFDNLIAKHDLPPMIGIFINPGVLPALTPQTQSRYERIFEYDSINGRYARFLIDEVIPEVAKKYNLSKDPNDHAISGVSTGGVGALVADTLCSGRIGGFVRAGFVSCSKANTTTSAPTIHFNFFFIPQLGRTNNGKSSRAKQT